MSDNVKIELTKTAKEILEDIKQEHADSLIKKIEKNKYIPGQSLIEITASDLINAKKQPEHQSFDVSIIYLLVLMLGTFLTLIGLAYNDFTKILNSHPEQVFLVIIGMLLTVFGIIQLKFSQKRLLKELDEKAYEMSVRKDRLIKQLEENKKTLIMNKYELDLDNENKKT